MAKVENKEIKSYPVKVTTGTGLIIEVQCSKDLGEVNISHCRNAHQAWTKEIYKGNNNNKKDIYADMYDDLLQ